jgi:hypothetical protein
VVALQKNRCECPSACCFDRRFGVLFGLCSGDCLNNLADEIRINRARHRDVLPVTRLKHRNWLLASFEQQALGLCISRWEGGSRMGRRIRVTAIKKEEPEVRLYVLALIALARQLQEEQERRDKAAAEPTREPAE